MLCDDLVFSKISRKYKTNKTEYANHLEENTKKNLRTFQDFTLLHSSQEAGVSI